ncbi:MAG: fasciclin domain-containing protein [Bacteroidota bacterium]|nr:fasciclin domain-containing protein [Bacteroidota bacterium]
MKWVLFFSLIIILSGSCRPKEQIEESREISGVSSETSDVIILDSAAKQTKGVFVGGGWIVPNHVLLENIKEPANIRTFNQLLQRTPLKEALTEKGPFTLFIPTDAAFQKLPGQAKNHLFSQSEKDERMDLIKHHLVPGKIVASDLKNEVVLKAADGHNLKIQNRNNIITVDGAVVIVKDGVSNNGVIHIIDRVLE